MKKVTKGVFITWGLLFGCICLLALYPTLPIQFIILAIGLATLAALLMAQGLICGHGQHLEDYESEIDMAKRVQQGLLSGFRTDIEGVNIANRCVATQKVGGDFYTFHAGERETRSEKISQPGVIQYQDRRNRYLNIAVGDVAGHGVSSALVMALASGIISEIGQQVQSPAKVLEQANTDLRHYLENSQISHVTAIFGVLHIDSKQFICARAGHPPAYLCRDGVLSEIGPSGGVFLGLFEEESYEEQTVQLESKDRLIFFTDGITESKNYTGRQFGFDNLERCILQATDKTAQQALDHVYQTLESFTGQPLGLDDQTLVIIDLW